MKSHFDLTSSLLEKYKGRPKKVGRYSVSDVWAIEKVYLTVEKFFAGQDNDFISCFRMWQGTWKHQQVQELLQGYIVEKKVEYPHEDWLLVGKADAMNEDHVLEIKTGDTIKDEAKEWHMYQGKIYCTIFQRPECFIVQPVVKGETIRLKTIGTVQRDDKWFEEKLKVIGEFHKKVYEHSKTINGN